MSKTMVLIDGTNYAFRAFFAIPPLSNTRGLPTNALHGFANMLVHYLRNEKPDYLAVAFDAVGPTFRKEQFTDYKAQRKECPPDLVQQMPYFRQLTEAFGIPFLELSGYEADDVIATIVRRTGEDDLKVRIISMDKDLMQLVDDRVTLIDTLRNKSYDPAAVEEKWGVPPRRLRDLLALQGDKSDNIPGVPTIGPKKARDLLLEFGSVPELLERVAEVKNAKLREVLQTNADVARLSLELVTLHFDVPLEMPLSSLALPEPDPEACRDLFRELEFHRLLKEFGQVPPSLAPEASVTRVSDRAGLQGMTAALGQASILALRVSGHGSGHLARADQLALTDGGVVWCVSLLEDSGLGAADLDLLRPILENPSIRMVGHDLKQDLVRLHGRGLTVAGVAGDTMIASYLLNPARSSHELAELSRTLLETESRSSAADQPGSEEVALILRLHALLEPQLADVGMTRLYQEMELPLTVLLADLEIAGIRVDCDRLKALSKDFEARLADMEARVVALAGQPFNLNSPKQLQTILFEKLKLPVSKKTKTGPSTDQSVLEELAELHELPAEILAWRSIVKLKNTYIDTLPKLVDPATSRVHTTFNQTVAATGRLSSSDPNLQNIPIRSEEGRKIRQAFVAEPGQLLLSADYSQIELRLLAHFSEDETLIHAFTHGLDIHAATAADMFGLPLEQVTSDMRRSAKAINFGILYGMGAFRLARELKIPRKEAEQYITRYFERYARVDGFLKGTLERAKAQGFVTTIEGRRRFIPDLGSSNFNLRQGAERIAVNTPIQGSAADIIKMAMRDVEKGLREGGFRTRMLLQVHDELVFEVPEGELEAVRSVIKERMEGVVRLKIPLIVELGAGPNWAEAH